MSEFLVLLTICILINLSSANLNTSLEEPKLLISEDAVTTEPELDRKTDYVASNITLDLNKSSSHVAGNADSGCVEGCEQRSSTAADTKMNNAIDLTSETSTQMKPSQFITTQSSVESDLLSNSTTMAYDAFEGENELDSEVKDRTQFLSSNIPMNDSKQIIYPMFSTTDKSSEQQTNNTETFTYPGISDHPVEESTTSQSTNKLSTMTNIESMQNLKTTTGAVINSGSIVGTTLPYIVNEYVSHSSTYSEDVHNLTEVTVPDTEKVSYLPTMIPKNDISEFSQELNETDTSGQSITPFLLIETDVFSSISPFEIDESTLTSKSARTLSEGIGENSSKILEITQSTLDKNPEPSQSTFSTDISSNENTNSVKFHYSEVTDDQTDSDTAEQHTTSDMVTNSPKYLDYNNTESTVLLDSKFKTTDFPSFGNTTEDILYLSSANILLFSGGTSRTVTSSDAYSQTSETLNGEFQQISTVVSTNLNDVEITTDTTQPEGKNRAIIGIRTTSSYQEVSTNISTNSNFLFNDTLSNETVGTEIHDVTGNEESSTESHNETVVTVPSNFIPSDKAEILVSSDQPIFPFSNSISSTNFLFPEATTVDYLNTLDTTVSTSNNYEKVSPTLTTEIKHREGKHIPFSTVVAVKETASFKEESYFTTSLYEYTREIYNQLNFEELRPEDKQNIISAAIDFHAKQNMIEVDTNLAKIHRWLRQVLNKEFKNWTRDPFEATSDHLDDIPFGNVSIFYLRPTPDSNLSHITLTFIIYNAWRNETLPVDFVLGILNFYSKDLKESINATSTSFTHGLPIEKYDLFSAMFQKYSLIIIIIFLAIILVSLLICVILLYRRKTRHSVHCLADSKLQHNMQESVGLDLTPATLILQDEKAEKRKICDDEGWLVPINQVPVAEDGNTPNIQDTKL